MKHIIIKYLDGNTCFEMMPAGTKVLYKYKNQEAISIWESLSEGDKVLVYKENPSNGISLGLHVVSQSKEELKLSKDFEFSSSVNMSDLPIDIREQILQSEICEISEQQYNAILQKLLSSFAHSKNNAKPLDTDTAELYSNYLSAIRTKPFLLLAGISGTGKSRIVREFAFMSCPKELQDVKKTTPGNYLMVEVKPNWHDSTELLGYYSNISKKYIFTKFVKFLVKAMMFPDTPFFVCLDEMNLAPVEQYFAEFLSVLETRRLTEYGHINTGALVDKGHFIQLASLGHSANGTAVPFLKNNRDIYMKLAELTDEKEMSDIPLTDDDSLLKEGLTLPDNVIIVGTVNMDDTTYKFSRKVIDRAMTIEMNGGKLHDIFKNRGQLEYRENPLPLAAFQSKYVSVDDVLDNCEAIRQNNEIYKFVIGDETEAESLSYRLKQVNDILEGTPFQVSYRVMNELVIYFAVLLDQTAEKGDNVADAEVFKAIAETAIDDIMLMKILPRVEGDEELLGIATADDNTLAKLKAIAPTTKKKNEDGNVIEEVGRSAKKLGDMISRLGTQGFTRFWP